METKLRNLRSSMEKTVLKPGKITTAEKNRILVEAINGGNTKRRNLFAPILSAIVVTSFLLLLGSFLLQNVLDGKETKHNVAPTVTVPKKDNDQYISASDQDKDNPPLENSQNEAIENEQPTYPYIVLNGYYYKKTDREVISEQLGEQIASVERTGDWAIKKSGDSNEIPPGPIYSINGENENLIAAKGVSYKNGTNVSAYIVFQKSDKIMETNTEGITSAKGDPQETKIAFENIKKKVKPLYGFVDMGNRTKLELVSYSKDPTILTYYHFPEGDIQENGNTTSGLLFINQYRKGMKFENSRFDHPFVMERINQADGSIKFEMVKALDWEKPLKIDSLDLNGISWGIYQDSFHNDFVLKGETEKFEFEITTQGDFTLESLKGLLESFKEVN
jgi:hypothetical protein